MVQVAPPLFFPSAKVAKGAVARLTPIYLFRSYNAAIKRERYDACISTAEREQGRCDSSKGNTFGWQEWDRLFQTANV